MRFKKLGAAALAAALTATSVGIYAYAEEDQAMKTEMTYVKQRITIPEDYSEFNYRTNSDSGYTRYNFSWSTSDSTKSISVSITGKVIKSIYIDNNDYSSEPGFAKLSNEQLIATAKKYIGIINPDIASQTVIDEDTFSIDLFGDNATLRFHREVNGVPVTGQSGYISINKNTGSLIRYNFNWINGAGFSNADDAISLDDAKKAYINNFDIDLVYTASYNWEDETFDPHLIYRQTSSGQINAFTGKLSTFDDYGSYDEESVNTAEMALADAEAPNPATGGDNGAVTFSQAEIEKLEKEGSLIKADDALKKLAAYDFFLIPENSTVMYQSCDYDTRRKCYVRNVGFSYSYADYIDLSGGEITASYDYDYGYDMSGFFTINAENGELLSYYNYYDITDANLTESKGKAVADKALGKLLGSKKGKFGELEDAPATTYTSYDPKTGAGIGNPITTEITYSANREEYGIKCSDEYVNIMVTNNGYVSSFSLNYYDNISYPKPDNIISKSKAYANFFDQVDFGLRYRCAYRSKDKKIVSALVYAADDQLRIDAFTGKRANWNGSPYSEANEKGEYTDLSSSTYRLYAQKLADYGILLMDENGRLNEKETITAGDFVDLLASVGMWLDDEDIDKDAKLSKQAAAKIVVSAKYGSEVAELKGIYKSPFTDVPETSDYVGYIAIANAAGILGGTAGKFYPTANFTRGEALKLVYDCLA